MYQLLQSYLGNEEALSLSQPLEEKEEIQPSPALSEEQPSYTFDNIKKFTGNDTEALVGFLEGFIITNQDNIHHLQEALENKDTAILSFYAHKMMPNIQHMGAGKLVSILKKLELLSEEDTLTQEVTNQAHKAIALTKELIVFVEDEILSLKAKV
jgi:hypothetical protein